MSALKRKDRMMVKRIVFWAAFLVSMTAVSAYAQVRAEVGVFAGWTFADGVSGDAFIAPDLNVYDRLDPKDSFGWGFDIGVFVTPQVELGFLYSNQPTTLEISGTNTVEIGDMSVTTYHGYFAYNFGEEDAFVRPYILGGFGATTFGDVEFTGVTGVLRTIGSETQYSSTWGAGVKVYPSPRVGVRIGARWTPTYIKSDAAGWWCDPYWGCYLVGDAQYSNLFELSGGVSFRF
jgi:hypothetical protein